MTPVNKIKDAILFQTSQRQNAPVRRLKFSERNAAFVIMPIAALEKLTRLNLLWWFSFFWLGQTFATAQLP